MSDPQQNAACRIAPAQVSCPTARLAAWPRQFRRNLYGSSLALIVGLCGTLPLPAAAAAANDDTRLFEVYINGRTTNLQAEFAEHGKKLFATISDLHDLGLRTDGLHPGADGRVELGEISGLTYVVDERHQVLRLTLGDRRRVAHKVARDTGIHTAPLSTPEFGAVLNYQFDGTEVYGRAETETALDGRISTPWGVGATSWLVNTGLPIKALTRLDTNYTVEEPDSLRRWEIGDIISSGLSWTRPYRLAGLQVSSDFGVRPGLVTYPTPQLAGHADVPSTVDVLVDNVRQVSQSVDQGPFELNQAPVVTGANSVNLVVRDAAGHESVQSLDFYISPTLLAPGLATYSTEGGWLRPNYGLTRDNYTEAVVSGSVRYGVSRWFTAEAHAEGSHEVQMGGGGVAVDIFNIAAGSVSVAGNTPDTGSRAANTHGAPGGQASFGLQRTGRWLDLSVSATFASRSFRDVPSTSVDLPPTFQAQAGIGISTRRLGSLRLALVEVNSRTAFADLADTSEVTVGANRATIGSATYTRRLFGRAELAVNAYHDFEQHGTTGVTFGVSIPFGVRRAASADIGLNASRLYTEVEADQSAYAPGEVGWRGEFSRDPYANDQGQVSYVTQAATVAAEVDHTDSATGYRAEATGALVGTGRGVFFANRINDSYAVIDSGGVPNVGVLQENRPVGRTDSNGLLLLPTVSGWQDNRISLDPGDLPADVTGDKLETMLRLPASSGAQVRFALHRGTSAVIKLVLANGKPVPVGSSARLEGDDPVPVGHDGDVFLTTLKRENALHVRMTNGNCTAHFPFKSVAGTLPEIGPFTCVQEGR